MINAIIAEGYQVVAFTGIDSYAKDDRMVALTLRDSVEQTENDMSSWMNLTTWSWAVC